MAIDTEARRRSALGTFAPPPRPSGSIDAGERRASLWLYSGLAFVVAQPWKLYTAALSIVSSITAALTFKTDDTRTDLTIKSSDTKSL